MKLLFGKLHLRGMAGRFAYAKLRGKNNNHRRCWVWFDGVLSSALISQRSDMFWPGQWIRCRRKGRKRRDSWTSALDQALKGMVDLKHPGRCQSAFPLVWAQDQQKAAQEDVVSGCCLAVVPSGSGAGCYFSEYRFQFIVVVVRENECFWIWPNKC